MNQRLVYIDQLKGFAILMVVMGHVLQFCFKEGEPSLTSQVIVSFHMPLFAFLSGLMFTTICDFRQIVRKFAKQSHKLLLPFLSFLLIYAYTIRPEENMITHPFKLGLWYLLGWNITLLDSDGHDTYVCNVRQDSQKKIVLDDHVWIGAHSTILKGVELANNTIIPYGSVIHKSNQEENVVFLNRVLKTDIHWED